MDDFEKQMARELEVSTDVQDIVHCITARIYTDDCEGYGNQARSEQQSSALVSYGSKYGRDFMRDLEDAIGEVIYDFCNRIHEGDESNGL